MKLIKITWQQRFDFSGILQCEHCHIYQSMMEGYDDQNFHQKVIPAIKCKSCGKRSNETIPDGITDPEYQGGDIIESKYARLMLNTTYGKGF